MLSAKNSWKSKVALFLVSHIFDDDSRGEHGNLTYRATDKSMLV